MYTYVYICIHMYIRPILYTTTTTTQRRWCIEVFASIPAQS